MREVSVHHNIMCPTFLWAFSGASTSTTGDLRGGVSNRSFTPPSLTSDSSLQSVLVFPASTLLQGTEQTNSIDKMIPLPDFVAVWQLLPDVSQWVLKTVTKGYRIQFAYCPPCFQSMVVTKVRQVGDKVFHKHKLCHRIWGK